MYTIDIETTESYINNELKAREKKDAELHCREHKQNIWAKETMETGKKYSKPR